MVSFQWVFEVVGSLGELLAFGDNVTVVLNLLIGFICIGFERTASFFFFCFCLLVGRVMCCFWLCCGFICVNFSNRICSGFIAMGGLKLMVYCNE